MKRMLFTACVVVWTSFSISADAADVKVRPELEPLRQLVGTWRKEITVYPAIWTPQQISKTGRHTTKWVLDGNHLQEDGVDSDGTKYHSVYSYNPVQEQFEFVFFQSNQQPPQKMVGTWDAETKSFQWSWRVSDNITMVSTHRITSPDTFELKVIAKDDANRVYLSLKATGRRVKATPE